jgi:hypothetical protein
VCDFVDILDFDTRGRQTVPRGINGKISSVLLAVEAFLRGGGNEIPVNQ